MYLKVGSDSDALNLSKMLTDGNWMVLYYADWCGHCKTMKPEWQTVVNKFNNPNTNSNKINVAEIESQHIGKLLNKPEIEGFPTIKMYNNGKPVANFEDERIASKIEEFANTNADAKTQIITEEPTNHESSKMKIKLNNLTESNAIINAIENSKKNEIKMNNLILPISNSTRQNTLDLPCNEIRRAKPCKTNPKCMYDGTDFKCKDRIFMPNKGNRINGKFGKLSNSLDNTKNNMVGNIIFKNTSLKNKGKTKSKTNTSSLYVMNDLTFGGEISNLLYYPDTLLLGDVQSIISLQPKQPQ